MPFSAGFETKFWFDRAFVQKTCGWIPTSWKRNVRAGSGHPLEQPLRFALRPFSKDLEEIWRRTLSYLWCSGEGGLPLWGGCKVRVR